MSKTTSFTRYKYTEEDQDRFLAFPIHMKSQVFVDDPAQLRRIITIIIITCHFESLIDQHGFMAKRSTDTNLALFTAELIDAVDRNVQVDDLHRLFKSVRQSESQNSNNKNIQVFGITDNLLQWCASYLTNRVSRVVVNGKQSQPFVAT